MNVWGDDDFEPGATAYGTHPNRYLRMRPFGQSVTFQGQGGAAPFGPISAHPGFIFDGQGNASFVPGPGLPNDDQTIHVLQRSVFQADGQVEFVPRYKLVSGAKNLDGLRGCFLWARVSGGAIQTEAGSPGYTEYHDFPTSGIFFAHVKVTFNPDRLVLGYVAGGNVTILRNETVASFQGGNTGNPFYEPRKMRLVVNGDTVEAYRSFVGRQGAASLGGQAAGTSEQQVFSVQSSDWPTAAGRFGFGAQMFREDLGSAEGGITVSSVSIRDLAGQLLYRDIFERTTPNSGRIALDVLNRPGTSLMQAWTGDGTGRVAFKAHVGHMVRAGSGVALGDDISSQYNGLDQAYGWMAWQDPETNPQQHRSIRITFGGSAAVGREAGIWLRGSFQIPDIGGPPDFRSEPAAGSPVELDNLKTGYLLLIRQEAGNWSLRIDAYQSNPSTAYAPETIATADLGAAGLALGVPILLAMEVRNFDADTFGVGEVPAIRVMLNGNPVSLSSASSGVSIQSNWAVDLRSEAVPNGSATGLFLQVDAYDSLLCQFDDWKQEPLSDAPVDGGDDQASVVLGSEVDDKLGTLDVPLSWGIQEILQDEFREAEYETGSVQRSPRFSQSRRLFRVEMRGATAAERQEARQFWKIHRASEIPFTWTSPVTGGPVVVRFVGGTFQWARISSGAVAEGVETYGTFELEELFAHTIYGEAVNAP